MQSVNIIYTKIHGVLPDEFFKAYLAILPPQLQSVNSRYHRWEDRAANLAGKLLLIDGLRKMGSELDLNDLKFNRFGKPYFEGDINFSISHSGSCVVCAITKGSIIGLDVEQCRPITINDFRQIFSPGQISKVLEDNDPNLAFFNLWTIMESAVKADGRGISIPLNRIVIHNGSATIEGKRWYFKPVFLYDGYAAHLASEHSGVCIHTRFADPLTTTTTLSSVSQS